MNVKFPVRLVLAICLIAPSFAASYCVRQGATGSKNGADWVNAYTNLPATLVRGATYYVADGAGYTFNIHVPATDTNTNLITIRKATQSDHGSNVGWDPTYGDGIADWNPVVCAASHIVFDGVTGGGVGHFKEGHGFRIYNTNDTILFMLSDKWGGPNDRPSITNVTVAHTEMASLNIPGNCEGFNLTAAGAYFTQIICSNLYLHDIGDGNATFFRTRDLTMDGCWVGKNATSPDHHGVIIRMDYCNQMTYRNSWFEDGVGTGFIGAYDGTGSDVSIYGNVFCYSAAGPTAAAGGSGYGNGVIYTLQNTTVGINPVNWRVYNNTFYNLPDGNGVRLFVAGQNNVAYNNLFYKANSGDWEFINVTHGNNAFGSPNPPDSSDTGAIILTQDPFMNSAAQDFRLKAPLSVGALPVAWGEQRDAYGVLRGQGGVSSPGAYQYPALAPVGAPLQLVSP